MGRDRERLAGTGGAVPAMPALNHKKQVTKEIRDESSHAVWHLSRALS
jgi:hypothetical protein